MLYCYEANTLECKGVFKKNLNPIEKNFPKKGYQGTRQNKKASILKDWEVVVDNTKTRGEENNISS